MLLRKPVGILLSLIHLTGATLMNLTTFPNIGKSILQNTKFDYIIVGGGTAGLALARRLTEDPSTSVLVLEAGRSGVNDTLVTIPQKSFSFIATDIDWLYNTAPQKHANNQEINASAGKILGGDSAVNGLVWIRGQKPEYDAIEALGSRSWNWDNLFAAMKKSENLIIPTAEHVAEFGYTVQPTSHGVSGPVDVSFPPFVFVQHEKFINASIELGHPFNQDPYSGDNTGVFYTLCSQTANGIRETSEFAYLDPILSRRNLIVFSHALVTKINLTSSQANGTVKADGVEIQFPDGSTSSAHRSHSGEVILTAGAIRTPQLLELSGIGDPDILEPLGIDVKVNLPGVGPNYEDHTITILTYQLKPGFPSFDDLGFNATLLAEQQELYKRGEGFFTFAQAVLNMEPIQNILTPEEIETAKEMLKTKPPTISQDQFDIIKQQIFDGIPQIEYLLFNSFSGGPEKLPNTSYVSMAVTHLHPLSRGSIHIQTNSIRDHPIIDPNVIESDWDLWLLSKATLYARMFFKTQAFSEIFEPGEVFPGQNITTDAQMMQWVRENINIGYHAVGTASLLPREHNGVVDNTLKVYGTSNIRVADLSIFPLLLSAHTQHAAYAIAEMAATIIKTT